MRTYLIMIPAPKNEHSLPFAVHLIVTQKNGMPLLEIRRATSDSETIQRIISCAFHRTPIIVLPTFTNEIKAISSLIDKGIIYKKKEDGQYYFTI